MSQTVSTANIPGEAGTTPAPQQAGLVLATLIIVAAVANLPLAMANVALPSIGAYFDATQITAAAKSAFLAGDQYAYIAGIVAVVIGAALVFFVFPRRDDEGKLLAEYHAEDMQAMKIAGHE